MRGGVKSEGKGKRVQGFQPQAQSRANTRSAPTAWSGILGWGEVLEAQGQEQGGGGGEVEQQAVQGGPDVAGEFGRGGGGHAVGQDDGQEVAGEKEGQEEGRGGPEATAGKDARQEHGGPEEAEVERLNQGRGQIRDGQDELLRIKALDVVGADLEVLVDREEAPGEVAQDQPGRRQAQKEQAAKNPGGRSQVRVRTAARRRVAARGGPSYLHQAMPASKRAVRVRLPGGAWSASQR